MITIPDFPSDLWADTWTFVLPTVHPHGLGLGREMGDDLCVAGWEDIEGSPCPGCSSTSEQSHPPGAGAGPGAGASAGAGCRSWYRS